MLLSIFLCPNCLTKKCHANCLGTAQDQARQLDLCKDTKSWQKLVERARKKNFKDGLLIDGKAVKDILKHSMTPIRVLKWKFLYTLTNCITECIFRKAFTSFHKIFTVDLMHDIESGVWHNIFIHLIRIPTTQGPCYITELN